MQVFNDFLESSFYQYFQIGLDHILDVNGYDHMLFIVVLCAAYNLGDSKRIFWLITSFTIGHSITLVLASKKWLEVDPGITEPLIGITIAIAAFSNIFKKQENFLKPKRFSLNYIFAGAAGLIHGLGFSGYLNALIGRSESIVTPLFAFNIGLEIGQIIIVLVYILISFIAISIIGISQHNWRFFLSSAIAGVAFTIIMDKI